VLDAQPHVLRAVGLPRPYLVALVDVDDALLGLLHVHVGGHEQFVEDGLHILANVARLGQRRGVGDGERDVQVFGKGTGQVGLARAGRADQEDVALLDLDLPEAGVGNHRVGLLPGRRGPGVA
jgi:hypothetical protein